MHRPACITASFGRILHLSRCCATSAQRAACGYALAHALAAAGRPAQAAAEYRPVAGVLVLADPAARMAIADFLNFYLCPGPPAVFKRPQRFL
jgi:hypothetical protein